MAEDVKLKDLPIKKEGEFEPLPPKERPLEPTYEEDRRTDTDYIYPFVIDTGNVSYKRAATVQTTGKIRTYPGAFKAGTTNNSRQFLKLHPDFLVSGVLEADATVTSVDGDPGTEATLNSYTIPLNTISRNDTQTEKAGNVFRIRAAGRYTTDDATATVAIALKVGSTTYHTITTTGATVTNAPWMIDWMFIVSAIGSTGTAESYVSAKTNNVNKDSAGTAAITLSTIANQAITITTTWTNGSAGDDISIRQFIVELLN